MNTLLWQIHSVYWYYIALCGLDLRMIEHVYLHASLSNPYKISGWLTCQQEMNNQQKEVCVKREDTIGHEYPTT